MALWHARCISPEREAFDMAQRQTTNGHSDLRLGFVGRRAGASFLDIEAWMPSEIQAISPLVNRLMRLIEGSRCVAGEERAVELALWEALNNAVVHGNRMDGHKLVQVRCRCDLGKGVSLVVKDQGQGFDPNAVPNPLSPENLNADHGRGIRLMRVAMDEVSFEHGGTEVHMRKARARGPRRVSSSAVDSAKHGLALVGTRPNPPVGHER
jgi:serine/threonine-protein kinase RsbW